MVAGRTTEARTVAGVGTTATSTAITGPAGSFNEEDAGRSITGTGIPANATIASVTSATAAVLSAAATTAGTITATVGATSTAQASGQAYGFLGWSPETDTESETYTLAATNAGSVTPDRITNTTTSAVSKHRARG